HVMQHSPNTLILHKTFPPRQVLRILVLEIGFEYHRHGRWGHCLTNLLLLRGLHARPKFWWKKNCGRPPGARRRPSSPIGYERPALSSLTRSPASFTYQSPSSGEP